MREKLGSTEHGSAWALKALHPSDPLVEVHGIPDENATSSVFLNYQTITRINFPVTASNVWNLNMQLLPSPVQFAWYRADDGAGSFGAFTGVLNSQLGSTIQEAVAAWRGLQVRWRLAYAGATLHFDGPALANQGSVAAAQVPYEPRKFYFTGSGLSVGLKASLKVRTPLGTQAAPGLDYPTYATTVSSPNVYTGEVRDGLYVPLKLSRTHQKWHSRTDEEFWANATDDVGVVIPTSNPSTLDFPFPGADTVKTYGGVISGTAIPPLGSDLVTNVCIKNMSQQAGIVVMFRYGIEIQVAPGSQYSPMQEVAIQQDPLAVETYFAVSRLLKDAYPESYNDLGKLRDVILRGLKIALPLLQAVPGPVGLVASGASTILHGAGVFSRRPEQDSAAVRDMERRIVSRAVERGPAMARTLRSEMQSRRPATGKATLAPRAKVKTRGK